MCSEIKEKTMSRTFVYLFIHRVECDLGIS